MQRRQFIQSLAAGSLLLPVGANAWAAVGTPGPTQRKLVVVMLRGAVDGLSVVAPVGDARYAALRPDIALAASGKPGGALDLDGYFGLHPALTPLLPLWQQQKLAFVHAAGSPDTTRSHFDAQDYMESATPGVKSTADGWLNRLTAMLPGPGSATRALSVGPVMPRILSGTAPAINLANGAAGTRPNALDRKDVGSAFDQLYASHARFGGAYNTGKEAHQDVMLAAKAGEAQSAQMMAANGGAPLPNGFPDDAARLATLMRNEPKIQVAFVALGGWDTHANQGNAEGQLANRLRPLGEGLAVLANRLGPMFDDTVVVVMSEFGRTVRQNGNGGTDHGHGNVMWLLGGGVAGGKVYGDWQGLGEPQLYEGRDLPVTTDFRSVLAQVGQSHLQLSDRQLAQLFPAMPAGAPSWRVMRG